MYCLSVLEGLNDFILYYASLNAAEKIPYLVINSVWFCIYMLKNRVLFCTDLLRVRALTIFHNLFELHCFLFSKLHSIVPGFYGSSGKDFSWNLITSHLILYPLIPLLFFRSLLFCSNSLHKNEAAYLYAASQFL